MSSPKYRERFTPLLAPLEPHLVRLQTLESYPDLRFSPNETAEALGVHVNTVAYRLATFAGLMDCDLRQRMVR